MFLQLAEDNHLADQCGLPPIKPLRSRSKVPEKWAEYDRKRAEWEACRAGKGKGTNMVAGLTLAPGRAFFLALLDLNIDGLASRLAMGDMNQLKARWNKIGGDNDKLVKFINAGKGKPPRRVGFLNKFIGPTALAEDENPNSLTNDQKARIIAATTALGGTIAATFPPTAPVAIAGGPILGTVIVALMPLIKSAANRTAAQEAIGAALPPVSDSPAPGASPTSSSWLDKTNFIGFTNKQTLLVAGNLVGVGASAYMYKKKKNKKAAGILLGLTIAADAAYYFASKNNS